MSVFWLGKKDFSYKSGKKDLIVGKFKLLGGPAVYTLRTALQQGS